MSTSMMRDGARWARRAGGWRIGALVVSTLAIGLGGLTGCDTGRGESVPITPKKMQPDSEGRADTEGRTTETEEQKKERERREREEREREEREREERERRESEKRPYQQNDG